MLHSQVVRKCFEDYSAKQLNGFQGLSDVKQTVELLNGKSVVKAESQLDRTHIHFTSACRAV